MPGVDVLAYMIHPAVETWGREFLERGLIEARFTRPVYDGETVQVTAAPDGEGLALQVTGGDVRATGSASLTARLPAFALADYPEVEPVAVLAPVDAHSYKVAKWLGIAPRCWPQDAAAEYLADVHEADPIYARGGVTHPGVLQQA